MFDFEKLEIYKKAKIFNKVVFNFLKEKHLDRTTNDQLRRASFSIMLNISEGSSRFSKPDRKNYFVIARGSVFECVAIFDFLLEESLMPKQMHQDLYQQAEELSKMLFSMIRNLTPPSFMKPKL